MLRTDFRGALCPFDLPHSKGRGEPDSNTQQGRQEQRGGRAGQPGEAAASSLQIRENIMTSFTRTETQKAKSWRIIAQKNKEALHISWLPDRISTASVSRLPFHSCPKTSLSSRGMRGKE